VPERSGLRVGRGDGDGIGVGGGVVVAEDCLVLLELILRM
jgi:hypothetical protein